jgi:hypothetical protein
MDIGSTVQPHLKVHCTVYTNLCTVKTLLKGVSAKQTVAKTVDVDVLDVHAERTVVVWAIVPTRSMKWWKRLNVNKSRRREYVFSMYVAANDWKTTSRTTLQFKKCLSQFSLTGI